MMVLVVYTQSNWGVVATKITPTDVLCNKGNKVSLVRLFSVHSSMLSVGVLCCVVLCCVLFCSVLKLN